MISGICAGIVSNVVAHPLDTVKVRMQIGSTETVHIIPTIKTIYKQEGVRIRCLLFCVDKRFLQRSAVSSCGKSTDSCDVRFIGLISEVYSLRWVKPREPWSRYQI